MGKPILSNFKQDIIDLLSLKSGGHTQKWLYADHERPNGSGSALWHDFVAANKNYYPIQSESSMIPALVKRLADNFETVIDFGIGDSKALQQKTLPILRAQEHLKRYYAIDISNDNLDTGIAEVKKSLPLIETKGIQGDFYEQQNGIEGKNRLGLFLGATVSNIDMRVGDPLPHDHIIERVRSLKDTLQSGELVISFDANPNLDHALNAYQHISWQRMMTGLMYDVQHLLKPEGNFNPSMWHYEGIIDRDNHVLHQTISPSIDQDFTIDGHEFEVRKGQSFVVKNNWKPPVDVFVEIIKDAGLSPKDDPLSGDDNLMIMLEASL